MVSSGLIGYLIPEKAVEVIRVNPKSGEADMVFDYGVVKNVGGEKTTVIMELSYWMTEDTVDGFPTAEVNERRVRGTPSLGVRPLPLMRPK